MKTLHTTFLSLGTNQGNKLENLQNAINLIDDNVGEVKKISSIYKTPSWGFNGNDFYNICIKVVTQIEPKVLITNLLEIEKQLGRQKTDSKEYQNRSIDIDIILFEDLIIYSKALIIPHPRMLDRKFVLVPLVEIASEIIHPIEKKQLTICLQNCNDTSDIIKVDKNLKQPISLSEKYNYIAIEGNIGAGKTSLANLLSNEFNSKLILERYADNPFLPKFYENKERYAFPLEMSFLADRYQQLSDDLEKIDVTKNFIVSDYFIFKSLIFAEITLSKDEFLLYKKMYNLMYKEITKPDLYIYLYQNTERLLENIKKRGREYEQSIKPDYLYEIQDGYSNFIRTEKNLKSIVIDVSEMDFVNNRKDFKKIIKKLTLA